MPEQISSHKMANILSLTKLALVGFLIVAAGGFYMQPVLARTVTDIKNDINSKNQELSALQSQLKAAEADLASKKATESQAAGEVSKLQSEIDRIDADLKLKQLRMQELEESRKLKELEIEERQRLQDLQVTSAYIGWKTNSVGLSLFQGKDILKQQIYDRVMYTEGYGGILGIETELEEIKSEYDNSLVTSQDMQKELEELNKKKQELDSQLTALKRNTSSASSAVSGLRSQSSQLQSQISFLNKEEQEILRQQQQIYNETGNSNIQVTQLTNGEFYFEGRGSDFVTGHGIGFSQNGALGAALNNGWDYKRIVEFYFPGAKVGKIGLPATINVTGKDLSGNNVAGSYPVDAYLGGLGEVPDKACEDLGIAFSGGNYWNCWPREAIKAQIVVARTYAARRSGGICATDACQVFSKSKYDSQAKRWAADSTSGDVVVWNGGLADVYYSSDNNQGYGSANKETVWGGSVIPYLTNANDNSFAYKPYYSACKGWCGSWTWRTYSYSSEEMKAFFDWAAANGYPNTFGGLRNIGKINSISLNKDPSQRVNKLTFTGAGGQYSVGGKTFRDVWNLWNRTKPSNARDLMYSFTYNSLVKS